VSRESILRKGSLVSLLLRSRSFLIRCLSKSTRCRSKKSRCPKTHEQCHWIPMSANLKSEESKSRRSNRIPSKVHRGVHWCYNPDERPARSSLYNQRLRKLSGRLPFETKKLSSGEIINAVACTLRPEGSEGTAVWVLHPGSDEELRRPGAGDRDEPDSGATSTTAGANASVKFHGEYEITCTEL
jgi:hypothetical protein